MADNDGNAVRSQGAVLMVDKDTPGTPDVPVGCPTSFSNSGSAATVDVSCLESTSREYVAGLAESGEVSLTLNLTTNDEGQIVLRDAYASGSTKAFLLTLSDGMTLEFDATVTSYNLSLGVDEAATLDVTLQISGDITWTDPV